MGSAMRVGGRLDVNTVFRAKALVNCYCCGSKLGVLAE